MKRTDVLIIGGGPAGLMTAITLARKSAGVKADITVVEHKDKPGKKLLATGNGRCNFANQVIDGMSFRGENPSFAYDIIERFNTDALLRFMRDIGVLNTCINGCYYPRSLQAVTILEAMKKQASASGVNIKCGVRVTDVVIKKGGGYGSYTVKTDKGNIDAGYVVVATGGRSYKSLGSDGSGYRIAKSLGHTVTPLYPSLTGLKADGLDFKMCGGVRARGRIDIIVKDNVVCSSEGEIQFADYGISGIPVFQVGRYASENIAKGNRVSALLDLAAEYDVTDIKDIITDILKANKNQTMLGAVNAFVPVKLAAAVLKRLRIGEKAGIDRTDNGVILSVASELKGLRIGITGDCGFDKAQVTAGGVRTDEVSKDTLESEICRKLYFAGEVLDVDGNCGGYNLHFAYACGSIAGSAIAEKIMGDASDGN